MLGVKKHRGWQYTKFNKLWTPLVTLVVFTFLFMLVNFEWVVYRLNTKDYSEGYAILTERTTDTMFFTVPMVKLKYNYNGQEYEAEKYDNLRESINTEIKVWINKKAPNYILIQNHSMNRELSILLLTLMGISLVFLIRFIIKRHSMYLREWEYYKFLKVCARYNGGKENEQ